MMKYLAFQMTPLETVDESCVPKFPRVCCSVWKRSLRMYGVPSSIPRGIPYIFCWNVFP